MDVIILGIVGTLIALPFFDTFSRLGAWGKLVGFLIALPYFAILNSAVGNGQTLGKRLMHLQVVGADGKTISLLKATIRYALFAAAYFLNQLSLPISRTPFIILYLLSFIIFGLGGATIYLVLFNRHTRQAVHDLAVGSYVADADKDGPLALQPIWNAHWVILCSWLVILVVASTIIQTRLLNWGPFPHLLGDVRVVEALESVQTAGAREVTWTSSGSDSHQKILVIDVLWTGQSGSESAVADRIAKLILQQDSKAQEHDVFRIVISRGYDIGIASARVSQIFEHTPAEWKARLLEVPAPNAPEPAKL